MILDDVEIAPSVPILTGQIGTTQIPSAFPVNVQLQSQALRPGYTATAVDVEYEKEMERMSAERNSNNNNMDWDT